MLKIALTGNIASGKSEVEKILLKKGYRVFDTDEIAHKILETSDVVIKSFEKFNIITDNKIDRKKLGKLVFSDKKELKRLEEIVHPLVRDELLSIFSIECDVVFVSVPQLFEAKFEELFDKIICITSNEEKRLVRLMKRNNLTKDEAIIRIKSQLPDDYKVRKSDYVLENNDSIESLENKLNLILGDLLKD